MVQRVAFSLPALIVFSLQLLGCSERETARADNRPQATAPPIEVEVQTVRPQTLPRRIAIVGTLFAAEDAIISTKTAGILRRTFVDVGSVVKPDDPLTQVDRLDYEVAVKQAQASLAEVLARLGVTQVPDESFDLKQVSAVQRAAAQLENARFTYERLVKLGASMSEQELNDASTRLRVAEADYQLAIDQSAALVASASERQSSLQMAQQKLADALTRTPPIPTTLGAEGADDWIVAARFVTEGQYVHVGDQLYRLLISNPLKLRSKVPERYASAVRAGQRIMLEQVEGTVTPTGQVTRVYPAVDPASRTFEIEALIDNESSALKPGTFAKGVIVADDAAGTLCVPAQAVVTTGGAARVFVVENGAARQRSVQPGRQDGELMEIVSGLREGEQVVTRGAATLTDGMPVKVRSGAG